ncbi:5650_t:CDS:2 [Paraglomus occultum]|uniref:5650_t:CDS:1 n=1 Tax=Paraglomus occultum TaxID=144539 RepID=A0A9N9CGS2_9GLOM|nr:5650_t:CDS:2 [Paraglomus occultum]
MSLVHYPDANVCGSTSEIHPLEITFNENRQDLWSIKTSSSRPPILSKSSVCLFPPQSTNDISSIIGISQTLFRIDDDYNARVRLTDEQKEAKKQQFFSMRKVEGSWHA